MALSEKFHPPLHLVRFETLVEKHQHVQEFSNGVLVLVAVSNSSVRSILRMELQKIVIVSDDDSVFQGCETEMHQVIGLQQSGVNGCCDIDAPLAQTGRDS